MSQQRAKRILWSPHKNISQFLVGVPDLKLYDYYSSVSVYYSFILLIIKKR